MSGREREVERTETPKGERRQRAPTSGRPSGMRTAAAKRDHPERLDLASRKRKRSASDATSEHRGAWAVISRRHRRRARPLRLRKDLNN